MRTIAPSKLKTLITTQIRKGTPSIHRSIHTMWIKRSCLISFSFLTFQVGAFTSVTPPIARSHRKLTHRGSGFLQVQNNDDSASINSVVIFAKYSSTIAWLATSAKVLSYHPDPQFIHCTLQHNVWTTLQAWLFPLCVWTGAEPNMAMAGASLWLAAATITPATFSFGYDLIPRPLQIVATLSYLTTAGSIVAARFQTQQQKSTSGGVAHNSSSSLARRIAAAGMTGLALLPVLSAYPMATIPSILGKRLSRTAVAFYGLAAAGVWSNKPSNRGIALGASLHAVLVLLKLAGVDDGGYLLPGDGLWKWYPAMLKVPFALMVSLVIHCGAAMSCRGEIRGAENGIPHD